MVTKGFSLLLNITLWTARCTYWSQELYLFSRIYIKPVLKNKVLKYSTLLYSCTSKWAIHSSVSCREENQENTVSERFLLHRSPSLFTLRSLVALCTNWNFSHSLWMLFSKLLCWRLLMQYWTGKKAEDLWESAFWQLFRVWERNKMGGSPLIWKYFSLEEMFFRRYGGWVDLVRCLIRRISLLRNEAFQVRHVHADWKAWGLVSFFSFTFEWVKWWSKLERGSALNL